MSAPDPKAWEEPDDDPDTLRFAYGIARRRALAELRAFWEAFKNEADNEDDNAIGICEAAIRIRRRITEIELEELAPPSALARTAAP